MCFSARNSCGQVIVFIIACIHGVLSIVGAVVFIGLKMFEITENTKRNIIIISIFGMTICYLICVIELFVSQECTDGLFFISSYKIYGLF